MAKNRMQDIADSIFGGLKSGKLKPPKFKSEGETEVLSRKHEALSEALQRDFGKKKKSKSKPKRTGVMRRSMY